MNSVIPFKGQKVPEAFRRLDPNRSLGEGVQGGFPILNYRGKVWSLRHQGATFHFKRDDDGTALTYLDVIIVGDGDKLSKVYYPPGEWSEDASEGPVCSSVRGDVPDPGVPEPQSVSCATCKNNVWVTLPNGGRGKHCQDHKRLAVLLMPAVTKKMLGSPLLEPVYLKIPPGSLNALKAYGDMLRHESYPFPAVVTRISFSPDKLFRMVFEGKQVLTEVEAPLVLPLVDDPRTKRITGEVPDIRESRPEAPAIPKYEPVDTGLGEAFGVAPPVQSQSPPPPPRQAPPPRVAAPVLEKAPEEPQVNGAEPPKKRGRPPKAAAAAPLPQTTMAFDDEDTELDREVAGLLDLKVENMLK